MPWELKTVEDERNEFINEVLRGEESKSAICRKYGISRVTGDKWLNRYKSGEPMSDRSRAPFHSPNKTPSAMEEKVLAVRENHPAWGPRKIHKTLEKQGEKRLPATSTIASILTRNGCVSEKASQAATPYKRFQRESSNELWQTDFKGDFAMKDGARCHALTVLDDCSRFSLCIDAKENERREGVQASFTRIFNSYGMPEAILSDNGSPWGVSQSTGYTRFELWLMDFDILPIHGRIKHPQTQGKEERFHKTMEDELLHLVEIADLVDAQKHFDRFRSCYNNERPHEALGLGVPCEYYQESKRRMPEVIRQWGYPDGFALRKIKSSGYFTFGGQGFYLSEAFGDKTVGVRESRIENCINIYYRGFRIARIDLSERVFLSKKVYRADTPDVGAEI